MSEQSVPLPSTFRDRDIFATHANEIFVTHGFIQPKNRVICYLKYLPDPLGQWISPHGRYRRVFSGGPESVLSALQLVNSTYLFDDPHFGARLLEVPLGEVSIYYHPESRLKEIIKNGPQDPLETRARDLAVALHDSLSIPFDMIGVTGSIAWYGHDPSFSDVNMNIYGMDATLKLRRGRDALINSNSRIRFREIDEWIEGTISRLCRRVSSLSVKDLIPLFERRRELCLDDQYIGVMPILPPAESPIKYGSETYRTVHSEPLLVRLEVQDDTFGSFTPAVYTVRSPPLSIIGNERLSRLMIYDSAFKDLLRVGDVIESSGIIQRVITEQGDFYQMMIGTLIGAGREFIRLIK